MASNFRFNSLKQIFFGQGEKEKVKAMEDTSSKEKDKQVVPREKETELSIPETLRSEFHFVKFPFFDLCPRISRKDRIEIKEIEETEEGKIEVCWKVVRGLDNKFPSVLARKIHKEVVERNLNSARKPVSRLMKLGSLRQICKGINIVEAGENFKEIRKALEDITAAKIEARGTFRQKEKNGAKRFFDGIFHLYDMVIFTGETLPDGTKADAVYVLLNDMYIQNFNNNFVVPLDYQYIQDLKGDIAPRMYEILSVWFYPALENGRIYIEKRYTELCNYFPLTRQNTKWKAKKQLKVAHQQHVIKGFLATEPEWIGIDKKDDWLIRYYIGPKASNWHKQNKKLGHIDGDVKQLEEPKRVRRGKKENPAKQAEEISPVEEAKPEKNPRLHPQKENPLVSKLISAGISKGVAENLVKHSSPTAIEDWIEAIRSIKADNKAAFLVRAIQEEWALPESFRKEKEKRLQEEKEKKEEESKAQYNKFLKEKIDPYLDQMDQSKKEEELKNQEEIFVTEHPFYKQFQGMPSLRPYVIGSYREAKRKEMGLPSFEEWVREQENK